MWRWPPHAWPSCGCSSSAAHTRFCPLAEPITTATINDPSEALTMPASLTFDPSTFQIHVSPPDARHSDHRAVSWALRFGR